MQNVELDMPNSMKQSVKLDMPKSFKYNNVVDIAAYISTNPSTNGYNLIRSSKEETKAINGGIYTSMDFFKASSKEEEAKNGMDNELNGVLFNEIKSDLRERESRTHERIIESEKRNTEIIKEFTTQAVQRELRYENSLNEIKDLIKANEININSIKATSESKINEQIDRLESIKTQNFWGNIAMFVAMLGVITTIIIALT